MGQMESIMFLEQCIIIVLGDYKDRGYSNKKECGALLNCFKENL